MKWKCAKCVCSAFKCLHWINLILSFTLPIESETLHESFNKFEQHISFCVTYLQVLMQITAKPKLKT